MLSCFDVAQYFLSLVDETTGDSISNLKVQKLCYYAQGFHLAIYDEQLFEEKIEAWKLGPVLPVLYREYKKYGNEPIPFPKTFDPDVFSPEVKELLDEIWAVYGKYSAWGLSNITHREPPWISGRERASEEITIEDMKTYFRTQLNNGEN